MKKGLILGYGKSGKAAEEQLKRLHYQVDIYDQKENFLTLDDLKKTSCFYDIAVRSPGIKMSDESYHLAQIIAKSVISEIELGYTLLKRKQIKFIAVSGTNGKTTLVSLFYEVLKAEYANVFLLGNIGTPLCAMVEKIPNKSIVILEISSFQAEDIISFHPQFLYILNIAENHLDHVYNYDFYRLSKARLAINMTAKDYLFIAEKEIPMFAKTKAKVQVFEYEFTLQSPVVCPRLHGPHAQRYVNLALDLGYRFAVPREKIISVIKNFVPPPFRMEVIKETRQYRFINDAKSTTIASTNYCLETFKIRRRAVILGGIFKGGKIDELNLQNEDLILLFGRDAGLFQEYYPHAVVFTTLKEIICYIKSLILPDKIDILFSPSCASFDQYQNYQERGKNFQDLVNEEFADE